ncbi:MAG: hypothetical protein ACLFTB_05030 [Desulfovibrionales bacterium]
MGPWYHALMVMGLLLLVPVAAVAGMESRGDLQPRGGVAEKKDFISLDRNEDANISWEEFTSETHPNFTAWNIKRFMIVDDDGSGFVSREEWEHWRMKTNPNRSKSSE